MGLFLVLFVVLLLAFGLLVAVAFQVATELEATQGRLSRAECDLSHERLKNELWREDYLLLLEKNLRLHGKVDGEIRRRRQVAELLVLVTDLYLNEECDECSSAATSKATS